MLSKNITIAVWFCLKFHGSKYNGVVPYPITSELGLSFTPVAALSSPQSVLLAVSDCHMATAAFKEYTGAATGWNSASPVHLKSVESSLGWLVD